MALLLASCSRSGGQTAAMIPDSLAKDSIKQVDVAMPKPEFKELPDTQFVSWEGFEYQIDIRDTVHSGVIEDYEDYYSKVDGILMFRGSMFRDANFHGSVKGRPDTVVVEWEFATDFDNTPTKYGTWGGGTGWTGQPLFVNWPDSVAQKFKDTPSANLTKDFANEEIIFGSLASKLYFLNFETGKKSRTPINVNNPIKGTPLIDPLMNGKVYVGQGVPARPPYGQITVDLFDQSVKNTQMSDPKAWRGWGASDSSPIRVGQFVFRPSENGTIYKFYVKDGQEILHSCLRYRKKGSGGPGMESTMSVFMNYGFVADNHGNLICVNLNNMKPVWRFDNKDDSDATPVVSVEDGHPYLYIGCEMDRQGDAGQSQFVKVDALNGEAIWTYTEAARKVKTGGKHFDGGYYATALLGEGNCAGKVFVNYVANESGQNGYFYCFDAKTGKLDYKTRLKFYSWSSPVKFLNENNEMFVFTGDTNGRVYLFDGESGKMLYVKTVGANFESSPIVVRGNHVVLGSRGNMMYKMRVEQR